MRKFFYVFLFLVLCFGLFSCQKNNGEETDPQYEITLKDGLSGEVVQVLKLKNGDKYSQLPDQTKDGYDFLGWYFNNKKISKTDTVNLKENATFTSKWEKIITWDYQNESWVYSGEAKEKDLNTAKVYFHYHRNKNDYDNWAVWIWQENGVRYRFGDNKDKFGVYYVVDLNDETLDSYHAQSLGYIFHYSVNDGWGKKDIEADRFLILREDLLNDGNEIHIFATEGDKNIYTDYKLENMLCEIEAFKLDSSLKKAKVTCNCKGNKYFLYENDQVIKEGTPENAGFDITLPDNLDFINNSYSVKVEFDNNVVLTKDLNFNAYYDSSSFEKEFTYDGDDLGVTLGNNSTQFRLWAPLANKVSLQLWQYGHNTSYGTADYPGDDTPLASYDLEKDVNGTWLLSVDENLVGKYYTYTVTNGTKTTANIVDPYAKAAGLNGMRGYIVDFSTLNPAGWDYERNRLYSKQELIVYELHVRDLTMDSTWTGTEANRGKYLGLSEAGTTYEGVTTGFDHIKELGINALQILPFFDQANDERKDEFNWGYNPQNYNVLEGMYSSNPYDAEVRIREFKQMVQAYNEVGIEIIMDVVYNHVNNIGTSPFDMIVPGYYFRYNDDGSASNGSGCGNETASDRSMFRKFMLDSTKFWATEYNLSGFRFDLMGLHDTKTMNQIAKALSEIDANISIWGEPWTGGGTPLEESKRAITDNGANLINVSFFNDAIRDKIKGSVFNQDEGYWLQGGLGQDQIGFKFSLVGTGLKVDSKYTPGTLLNYVSCHDNNTLRDKLVLTGVEEKDLADADIVAQALCILSEGIPFILSGEEFMRSKPIYNESGEIIGLEHNSYCSPDETNALRWDQKKLYMDVFEQYKNLIALNKVHNLFHITTAKEATLRYEIIENNHGVVGVKIHNGVLKDDSGNTLFENVDDSWNEAIILFSNFNVENYELELTGDYKVEFASNVNYTLGETVSGKIAIDNYGVLLISK